MKKIIFIDDVMRPSFGGAISTKPIIESYIDRYNRKLQKEIKGYCIKSKEDYIFHILVPSEKNEEYDKNIFYDVILQFYPVDKLNNTDLTIKNYGIKVFCNAPSWMFGFTYIFAKTDNIPDFVPKKYYSKAALTEPPKEKNPYKLYGIERVVFSALYYLEINTSFRKNRIELITVENIDVKKLLNKIMSQEEKLEQVEFANKKLSIKKGTSRKKPKAPNNISSINKKESIADKIYKTLKDMSLLKSDLNKKVKQTGTLDKNNLKTAKNKNDSLIKEFTSKLKSSI